jgi:hypothetical protein
MARAIRRVVTGHHPDGDVVIQRGSNHAWNNRSDELCRLGMVFIDSQEPAEIRTARR